MFEHILKPISGEVSAELAFAQLKSIYESDRWFTFPAFLRTADYVASQWKGFGLSSVSVEKFPADGRTRAGAWVLPFAWDVEDATLTIEEPEALSGTVIARYRDVPTSLAMWSAPTPKRGVAADLVWIENAADASTYDGRDVAGKIVFTSARPVFAKGEVSRRGALGMLSDFVPHPLDTPDATFWTNAWSDDPGGWGLTDHDSRIFGFDIPPRKGRWLREMIARHGRIRVRAVVSSRLYKGELPAATAVIPGEKRGEEVLVLGHAFEQGANDNASGCAVMLESARALAKLIADGVLPRPRRTIRFLIVSECYSTFAYAQRYRDRMAKTVAAFCFDSVAHKQHESGSCIGLYAPPDAAASFVTAFAERLAEAILTPIRPEYKWTSAPYLMTDNVVTDPMIGPPTVTFMPYKGDRFWHTSADTPSTIDVDALGAMCRYAAAYLYILAAASPVDALFLWAQAGARARGEISRMSAAVVEGCRDGKTEINAATRRVLYVAERGAREVESTLSLLTSSQAKSLQPEVDWMTEGIRAHGRRNVEELQRMWRQCGRHDEPAEPSAETKALRRRAEKLVPVRKYIGTITYETLSPKEREGREDPRWDQAIASALFWCDGKRTLAEVLDLAGNEHGRELFELVPVFEFMAARGLIQLESKP